MQSSLQTLYGYWNEVRAGRLAPQRLEIEPSRIAEILADTFMLELVDSGTYPYRLAGTRLCEMFGSELRGRNFLDGWSETDRSAIEGCLASICEQGAVAHLILEGTVDTRHRVELEANLLPLQHAGRIARLIGAMRAISAPHWLGSEPLRSRRLTQHRLVWPDGSPHATVPLQHASQASPLPPMATSGQNIVKADQRRFRVLEGGRASGKHDRR